MRWGLKQSCRPHRDLSNDMWHVTWTQGNQDDSQLLMVRSQIGNLIPSPSFGHNLCFRYPNGSCDPIFYIYVPKAFQWYKELFNPMSFDLCNHLLKIQKSIGTSTPKMGAHLGVWGFIPSHSLTLPGAWYVILELILGLHLCKPLFWSWTQGQGCDNFEKFFLLLFVKFKNIWSYKKT